MVRYVGIDLHKELQVACILDESGQVVAERKIKEVTRESLETFATCHLLRDDQVVLEVTTHVWAVARILQRFVQINES